VRPTADADALERRFGATVDVAGPPTDGAGFFLVRRTPDTDHAAFRAWLLDAVGGPDRLLLAHADGLFVVWTTFGVAEWLRTRPPVAHAGGVTVDPERLRSVLARTAPPGG
jgi:hypothetical protein